MQNLPFVSVIIPCRNEERFILKCLDSIISNDYPKERLEVLVIDGMSEDKTREILKEYIKKYPPIKLLDNPEKYTPFALNIGIKKARGEVIVRMDAHATYERNYISKSIEYLEKYKADNVGGVIRTLSAKNTITAKAITVSLSHPFGAGDAYYRRGYSNGPKWVDTVFGGCYRREIFGKIGLFNEKLLRSQDMEFNLRLKRAGGKILLVPDIVAYYYPKSNLKEFFIHNFKDGFWQTYEFKFTKKAYRLRHYLPLLFVLILIGSGILTIFFSLFTLFFLSVIGLYLFFAFYFSLKIVVRKREWKYLFLVPLAFICRHFGHGLGSLIGIVKIFLP